MAGVTNEIASDAQYEELRGIALDILADRERVNYTPSQYTSLASGVAEILQHRQSGPDRSGNTFGHNARLPPAMEDLFVDVYMDLVQQGIIIQAHDSSNMGFPWCRLSRFGKKVATDPTQYFFHDVSTYEEQIKRAIPNINDVTLMYLKEAMHAFRVGCFFSSTVMLGVATEHIFLLALEAALQHPQHGQHFQAADRERSALRKFRAFRDALNQHCYATLSPAIREDLETDFEGILSVIRKSRNEAGHPTGVIPNRDNVYVLLHLFINYAKKMYQLIAYFS